LAAGGGRARPGEGGGRFLHSSAASLSQRAETSLRRLGVEVRTNAVVTRVTPDAVWLGSEQIRARTVLWAAGVQAASVTRTLGVPLDRSGRILVEADLSIPGHPESFAVAEGAACLHQGQAVRPGVAPVARKAGRAAAANVLRRLAGQPTLAFHYHDKGSMATIGRAAAVAVLGRVRLTG